MTVAQPLQRPAHEYCAQVMLDTLKDEDGIVGAHLDTNTSALSLDYDPALIPPQRIAVLADKVEVGLRNNYGKCHFRAGGMTCDACLARFEGHTLAPAADVPNAIVQTEKGVLSLSLAPAAAAEHVEHLTRPLKHHIETAKDKGKSLLKRETLEPALVAITLIALLSGIGLRALGAPGWVITTLATISYAAGGYFGLRAGLESLRHFEINVDLLMLLAAAGAALIGSWPEGATLLFLFSLSNLLQTYALDRSRQAIHKLLDLRPPTALVRRGDREVEVLVETLKIGETVIIKPGERIPVDGDIISGASAVDQSSITGESIPVERQVGDQVFAGTVNQNGALEVSVSKTAEDTTLAKIIRLVEDAQEERAPTQRFLDTFEQYYAIFVIVAVTLFIAIPVLFMGRPFEPAFYKGMVLLVVASPCALVISTPASILSAIADAARKGILFKGGVHLENAATLKVIAFDKTGTLTYGKPHVTNLVTMNGYSETDLLSLAAAVESRSEHPLAQAVIDEAKERGLSITAADDFQAHPGIGVRARVNGTEIMVGGRRLMEHESITIEGEMDEVIEQFEKQGKTVLLVHNHTCVGAIAVADQIRPQAKEMIAQLKQNGIERVAMLTGDNERVAQAIAAEVGVDEVHAALMPDEKVERIKTLREKYGAIAMVGDGVNDAPALATATIGIAMGAAGTDVALETADIVLMSDDLTKLPYLIRLSRRSRRIIWQNISFALAVIALLIMGTFGVFGQALPLPLGVVGHEGSTVLVVFNGLRLLAFGAGGGAGGGTGGGVQSA